MQQFLKNKKNGFTLVETLVAIAIFSISILGILSVLASSITDTTYAKNKVIAGYLAQEGIEYLRNIRDNDVLYSTNGTWVTFTNKLSSCTSGSSLNTSCGFNSSTTPTNAISFFTCASDSLHCQLYFNNGIYNDVFGGVSSGFVRKVWMTTTTNPNEVKIFSEVDYPQGSITSSIIFSEDLFNWESQ